MIQARHLLRSSLIVILLFGLGKATGFVRTLIVGHVFGTEPVYSAFTAANQLPEVFVTLISGGALAAAFIPVYSTYLTNERQRQAAHLANSVLTLVILILGAVCALGAFFAPVLVRSVLVPGYPPEQQMLTASLMRIILVSTTMFGVSGVLSSILNTHQHFALPALTTVTLDIGYVVGVYLLAPELGIYGLAWGTMLAGVLNILIQLPALLRYGFHYRPQLDLNLAGVREVIVLMGPRIVTLGAIQVADLFLIRLLSRLPSEQTAAYFYGYTFQQLPETLLGTSIAIVVFPTMAALFNSGDLAGLKRLASMALRIIWTLTIPAAAGMILLGRPAIQLLFERGAFDAESTRLVYIALLFFSLRVVSEATLEIVARLFYAQHDTKTPMFAAIGWLVIMVALAYLFVGPLGLGGLALASSLAFTVQAGALFVVSNRRIGALDEGGLRLSMARALLATIVMSAVILLLRNLLPADDLIGLSAVMASGLLSYLLANLVLGGREIPQLIRLIRRQPALG